MESVDGEAVGVINEFGLIIENSIRKLVIYVFGESDLNRLLEMLLATKGATWGEPDQVLMEDGIDTSGTGCVRI